MLGVNFVFVQVRDYLLNQKRRGLKQRHGACLSASVCSGLPFFELAKVPPPPPIAAAAAAAASAAAGAARWRRQRQFR
jgi:hypothetical protein